MNHESPKFIINDNVVLQIQEGMVVSYKDGIFQSHAIDGADAIFSFIQNKLVVKSKVAYLDVPHPENAQPFGFFINPEYHEEEILLGTVQIRFYKIKNKNNETYSYGLVAQRIGDEASKRYAKCTNLKNIFLLGRGSDLLESFHDQNISSSHCFVGFEQKCDMFYVLDYGRDGKGTVNGTQVKIKEKSPYEIMNDSSLRIIVPPKCDIKIGIQLGKYS